MVKGLLCPLVKVGVMTAGQQFKRGKRIGASEQRLANQDGVNADSLQLGKLSSLAQPRFADNNLPGRNVGQQLVGP